MSAPRPRAQDASALASAGRGPAVLGGIGAALVGIVALQVVLSIAAGMAVTENPASPTKLYHRLGVPFGGLGAATMLFLVLGIVISALPGFLGHPLADTHRRLLRTTVAAAVLLAAILSIGSVLAVVGELHSYTAQSRSAPTFVRIQLGTFLLGTIATAGATLAAASFARRLVTASAPEVDEP